TRTYNVNTRPERSLQQLDDDKRVARGRGGDRGPSGRRRLHQRGVSPGGRRHSCDDDQDEREDVANEHHSYRERRRATTLTIATIASPTTRAATPHSTAWSQGDVGAPRSPPPWSAHARATVNAVITWPVATIRTRQSPASCTRWRPVPPPSWSWPRW